MKIMNYVTDEDHAGASTTPQTLHVAVTGHAAIIDNPISDDVIGQ